MSKRLNSRRQRKIEKVGDIERVKSIVIDDKVMQYLSRATIINYNKVFTSLSIYFDYIDDPLLITEKEARDYIRYSKNEHVHYKDKLHSKNEIRGLKASTINTYIKLCKSIYQTLVDLNYIESNPFRSIKCLKRQNERLKTISKEDISKLLNSLDSRLYNQIYIHHKLHI